MDIYIRMYLTHWLVCTLTAVLCQYCSSATVTQNWECYTLMFWKFLSLFVNSALLETFLVCPIPCSCSQGDCHFRQPSGELPSPCLLQLHCGQLPSLQHHLAPQWGWGPGSTSQSEHQHSPGGQQDTGEHSDPPQHHCREQWDIHLFSREFWRINQHDHWVTSVGWVRETCASLAS